MNSAVQVLYNFILIKCATAITFGNVIGMLRCMKLYVRSKVNCIYICPHEGSTMANEDVLIMCIDYR